MKIRVALLLALWIQAIIASPTLPPINITPKPILFNPERVVLTRIYRHEHYGVDEIMPTIIPRMIVLHATQLQPLSAVIAWFYPPQIRDRAELSASGGLNVSVHFVVDRDGTIYQLMPRDWMARHVIGLNNIAIGIENVGGVGNRQDLTRAQVDANAALIRWLLYHYPTIRYLIGHYEYGRFRGSALWQEKDPHYFIPKQDPGPLFMQQVRAKVADLHLQDAP